MISAKYMTRKALEDVMRDFQWYGNDKLQQCKRELDRRNRLRSIGSPFRWNERL